MKPTPYRNSRKDPTALEVFVAVLLYVEALYTSRIRNNALLSVLDALHTALCTYGVYW